MANSSRACFGLCCRENNNSNGNSLGHTDKHLSRQAKSSPSSHNSRRLLTNNRQQHCANEHNNNCTRHGSDDDDHEADQRQAAINFWHYKQTGIRSRPIKLLTHPIEHIERKIIITYLLGFLFKFMAISTGPIIVLILYLLTLPFTLARKMCWFLLNLSFLCDARIRTTASVVTEHRTHVSSSSSSSHEDKRKAEWNYCPLNFIETYWFKEKLINNVILIIEEDDERKFSIDKLRKHLRRNVLSRPEYRRFLCEVVARGIPCYQGYYWHYLGPPIDGADDSDVRDDDRNSKPVQVADEQHHHQQQQHHHQITRDTQQQQHSNTEEDCISSTSDQFSVTSRSKSTTTTSSFHVDSLNPSQPNSVFIDLPNTTLAGVDLRQHVYMDQSLNSPQTPIRLSTVRRYACKLLSSGFPPEPSRRPLWELRAIKSSSNDNGNNRRIYLIFRCHQSLADGKSLSKMLTEHLTKPPQAKSDTGADIKSSSLDDSDLGSPMIIDQQQQQQNQSDNYQQWHRRRASDCELKPLKEKESFVARVSEANSRLSAIFVGPLTVLLWIIWSFTRRKNNHLNKCLSDLDLQQPRPSLEDKAREKKGGGRMSCSDPRRFYMTRYDLTKFHQIKQMTRSTVSDVILCALSGALRDYLRKFNAVSNPPDLNISLMVDMRQRKVPTSSSGSRHKHKQQPVPPACGSNHQQSFTSNSSAGGDSSSSGISSPSEPAVGMAAHHCQPSPQPPPPTDATNGSLHCCASGGSSSADSSKPPAQAEVNCTMVNLPIPTSVEGTVPRLWDIRGTMEELRTSADPWVMVGLQRLLFEVLPATWYRSVVNYIALGNSSMFVSNIQGPQNMVESWCVDLFQRALLEARQSPKIYMVSPTSANDEADSRVADEDQSSIQSKLLENASSGFDDGSSAAAGAGKLMKTAFAAKQSSEEDQHRRNRNRKMASAAAAAAASRLELVEDMGSIVALYYCMQPPTSNIPISFNCITYHNKLFVSSLSRSLLVEDSKLLIRLFFRQLDQLADTIARRRSLVTIIQSPASVPIELQPSSPTELAPSLDMMRHEDDDDSAADDEEEEEEAISFASRIRSRLFASHKDDLDIGSGDPTAVKCQVCSRTVCACRRRKSLFALDGGKERALNLMSLLRPVHGGGSRSSGRSLSPQSASPNEDRSLDELREEDAIAASEESAAADDSNNNRLRIDTQWKPSANSQRSTLSLDISARDRGATITGCEHGNTSEQLLRHSDQNFERRAGGKNRSQESGLHNSDQLIVPSPAPSTCSTNAVAAIARHKKRRRDTTAAATGLTAVTPATGGKTAHSRSETDLLPSVCRLEPRDDTDVDYNSAANEAANRRGSAASWLTFVRRHKLSKHSRSATAATQQQLDVSGSTRASRNSFANLDSAASSSARAQQHRSLFEASFNLLSLNGRLAGDGSSDHLSSSTAPGSSSAARRRRQSAAAGAPMSASRRGASMQQARSSVVLKDEMNADVSLRYHHHMATPFRSTRSRRFSTIVGGPSSLSGGQHHNRRSSLIPFAALMQNNLHSLPRMFSEDPKETHV